MESGLRALVDKDLARHVADVDLAIRRKFTQLWRRWGWCLGIITVEFVTTFWVLGPLGEEGGSHSNGPPGKVSEGHGTLGSPFIIIAITIASILVLRPLLLLLEIGMIHSMYI